MSEGVRMQGCVKERIRGGEGECERKYQDEEDMKRMQEKKQVRIRERKGVSGGMSEWVDEWVGG